MLDLETLENEMDDCIDSIDMAIATFETAARDGKPEHVEDATKKLRLELSNVRRTILAYSADELAPKGLMRVALDKLSDREQRVKALTGSSMAVLV